MLTNLSGTPSNPTPWAVAVCPRKSTNGKCHSRKWWSNRSRKYENLHFTYRNMKLHQVLTGSCNHYDQCLSVGSVESKNFIAYASGCDLVILCEDFTRKQIIPGVTNGYVQIVCVDCCEDTGKIAVSYGNVVKIFEPCSQSGTYRWFFSSSITAASSVLALAWSPLGDKLLSCGSHLQLWQPAAHDDNDTENQERSEGAPMFSVGDDAPTITMNTGSGTEVEWRMAWQFVPGNRNTNRRDSVCVKRVSFSSDGALFASLMEDSCSIEVWYNSATESDSEPKYKYIVLNHPHMVVNFSWRKASRYMPIGAVVNSLVSSCEDGICRVWTETRLPTEDPPKPQDEVEGPTTTQPRSSRGRLLSYLIRMRSRQLNPLISNGISMAGERRKFLHFHLAATISSQSDIPLPPFVSGRGHRGRDGYFILHWMNNKEMQFTIEATKLLLDLRQKLGTLDNNVCLHAEAHVHFADDPGPTNPLEEINPRDEAILDRRIDQLISQWRNSSDMLFAVNPIDGSLLAWTVDYLDNDEPRCPRQAQVSFASRLPQAIPIGDAMSMASHLFLYPTREIMIETVSSRAWKNQMQSVYARRPYSTMWSRHETLVNPWKEAPPPLFHNSSGRGVGGVAIAANAVMISKHENGSLNQWQLSFADNSKYQTILSLSHVARISGHRFHTNSAACHPALPLLLTTSHHNLPADQADDVACSVSSERVRHRSAPQRPYEAAPYANSFSSELILWQVESVGPLTKAGGLTELARINSPNINAFTNVAWLPTLLPSFSIGIDSKSPGALFVTHDGSSVNIFLAVIDARFVLAEPPLHSRTASQSHDGTSYASFRHSASHSHRQMSTSSSGASSTASSGAPSPTRGFAKQMFSTGGSRNISAVYNVVSLQSTAKPGCIIALDTIEKLERKPDEKTLLLHAFQEQLVTGRRGSRVAFDPVVNLATQSQFEERFYLMALVGRSSGECHVSMWCLTVKSCDLACPGLEYSVGGFRSRSDSHGSSPQRQLRIRISSSKVCNQVLPLPEGVAVVKATVAAGHSSAVSIYPACFSPYLIVTGCSDGSLRFWTTSEVGAAEPQFVWKEWPMLLASSLSSRINIGSTPVAVSCAYSGRVAVAYANSCIASARKNDTPIKLSIAIYECESTGGSEWVLEDVIELNHVSLPDQECPDFPSNGHDSQRNENSSETGKQVLAGQDAGSLSLKKVYRPLNFQGTSASKHLPTRPDPTSFLLKPKNFVHVDWVSTEDGSHVLSVAVGTQILIYSSVSRDIVAATNRQMSQKSGSGHGPGVGGSSTAMISGAALEELRWMKLREIELRTADDLPPLPMHTSWVREGLLVVGMENEIHVYSQWKDTNARDSPASSNTMLEHMIPDGAMSPRITETNAKRSLIDQKSLSLAASNMNMALIRQTYSAYRLTPSHSFTRLAASKRRSVDVGRAHTALAALSNLKEPRQDDGSVSLTFINEIGLFEAVQAYNPLLPQYHPRQLMEWMHFGRLKRVKAILAHLTRCIASDDLEGMSRLKSVSAVGRKVSRVEEVSGRGGGTGVEERVGEAEGSQVEIRAIPPLPIFALLDVDNETKASGPGEGGSAKQEGSVSAGGRKGGGGAESFQDFVDTVEDDVFNLDEPSSGDDDDEGDEGDDELRTLRTNRRRRVSSGPPCLHHFGPQLAKLLTERLTRLQLPGLTALDQIYLLAIADLMANTRADVVERSGQEWGRNAGKATTAGSSHSGSHNRLTRAMSTMGGETGGYAAPAGSLMGTTDSLDDCGLRFLLSMHHYSYLLKTLPMRQRAVHQLRGIGAANIVWAFHSEAEEELISRLPSFAKGEPSWSEMRQYGAGWWLRNDNTLKRCVEKIAKTAFQAKRDPIDAAIYYLAMRKKSVLQTLFRSLDNKRMQEFFAHDFTEQRWHRAALKNAYQLMGMQRFEHAAAFFLLGDSLNDAVTVCTDKLQDFQLALVLSRLYAPGTDTMRTILCERVLAWNEKEGHPMTNTRPHRDPFVRCMAWWTLGEHQRALDTLIEAGGTECCSSPLNSPAHRGPKRATASLDSEESDQDGYVAGGTSVFNFYNFLRSHPLIVRQRRLNAGLSATTATTVGVGPLISTAERRLYFKTAHTYFKMGCPALALEVLSKLPEVDSSSDEKEIADEEEEVLITTTQAQVEPASNPADDVFSWGNFGTQKPSDEDELKLNWSDDDDEEETKTPSPKPEIQEIPRTNAEPTKTKRSRVGGKLDIMAHQLKFIACLKIISEELSTLATGIEADGGTLRRQFYVWLEKEVNVLQQLCHYGCDLSASGNSDGITAENRFEDLSCIDPSNSSPVLLHVSPQDRQDPLPTGLPDQRFDSTSSNLETRLNRVARRRHWLLANQALLRSLMSFCSLHGASGVGLAAVRMELMLLLQEVQQDRVSMKSMQLLSPLPFPTTLPLLSAAVAQAKTLTANPVMHLRSMVRDSFDCFLKARCPYSLDAPSTVLTTNGLFPSTPNAAGPSRGTAGDSGSLPQPPYEVFMLRNLVSALSACVYQCLSDSTSVLANSREVERMALEGFMNTRVVYVDGCLLKAGEQRAAKVGEVGAAGEPNTKPEEWPGVSTLKTMLADRADVDTPNMIHLLAECLVSVYVGLLYYAIWQCEPAFLYRLASHPLDARLWGQVFGGGLKRPIRPARPAPPPSMSSRTGGMTSSRQTGTHNYNDSRSETPVFITLSSISEDSVVAFDNDNIIGRRVDYSDRSYDAMMRQRADYYDKVLGSQHDDSSGRQPEFNEKFIPPRTSIIVGLLNKPNVDRTDDQFVYDSDDSFEDDDDNEYDDDESERRFDLDAMSANSQSTDMSMDRHMATAMERLEEHSDPMSYSWCLMRYAIVQLAIKHVHSILQLVSLEHGVAEDDEELPMSAPRLYRCLKRLEEWERAYKTALDSFKAPPEDYLPNMESSRQSGPGILKYKRILEKDNTPFKSNHWSALPAKRLWVFLVQRECLFETFVRYIFRRGQEVEPVPDELGLVRGANHNPRSSSPPLRIVHRDADVIHAMCINNANLNCVTVATSKELTELDITNLLHPPNWLEDDLEYDIELLRSPDSRSTSETEDFIVVKPNPDLPSGASGAGGNISFASHGSASDGGIGSDRDLAHSSNVMTKRHTTGVSKMSAHPFLPYYICGTYTANIQVFEWSHREMVKQYTSPNCNTRITTVAFNPFGSKFGIGDSDGMVSLWRFSVSSAASEPPIFSARCHSRGIQNFSFLMNSSQFVTASLSFESEATLCVWDTLMPSRRPAMRFQETPMDFGCTSMCVYASGRSILAGTRRGDLAVLDLRAVGIRRHFSAHDGAVRSIIVNPLQEYCATGGADGNVKIWRLDTFDSLEVYKGEHVKSSIFRSADSTGVLQLSLADQHLFSCGADGTLKMRRLNEEALLSNISRA